MKHRFLLLTFCAFCLSCFGTEAQECSFDGIPWIAVPHVTPAPNQWFCFRRHVKLDKVAAAVLDVAVDSKYWLWVNGHLVVFEGELKRGPNPNDTYYDEVDITRYLKRGDNVLAFLVWYWGKDGFCHKSSGRGALLARLCVGGRTVVSDATWKASVHPAYGDTGAPWPNMRLPESNVRFDARRYLGSWFSPRYDDASWSHAEVAGFCPCGPWHRLVKRPVPLWAFTDIVPYDSLTRRTVGDTTVVTGKLPRNITVTPYIRLKARAGLLVDIRSDNYKGGSEYNVRGEYVTRSGVQTYEMPNYINGHHIVYRLPAGAQLLDAGYRETRYATRHLGSFRCSDTFYNTLWQKALNTMNLNMRDAIQDPDRERSQWWGDAAIILHEIFYSCDAEGARAVRKAMLNLVDWQQPDGVLFSPIPEGKWDKELPQQMLASVSTYGFWSYYRYTADSALMHYVYPHVKRYLALWNLGPDSLVAHRPGGWDWGDWGTGVDMAVLDNAWYVLALESAARMATLADDDATAVWYRRRSDVVHRAAASAFWDGTTFRSPAHQGPADDRANAMALLAGFADEGRTSKVAAFLADHFGASPYMEKYVSEALFSNGYVQKALDRMKRRYGSMVASPLSTLWEDWTIGGSGGGSINHGWAGSPLNLLSQYVGGIAPLGAGWDTILVKPQLGSLQWVRCTVPVAGRTIAVGVSQGTAFWSLEVDNRTGRPCVVALPSDRMRGRLLVGGKSVASDDAAALHGVGLRRSVVHMDGFVCFDVATPRLTLRLSAP